MCWRTSRNTRIITTLLLLSLLSAGNATIPTLVAQQSNPSEVGAPLHLYLRVSPYDRRPYLHFYPPTEEDIQKESTLYFNFNSTQKTYRLLYPRVYMKTLYYRPDPTVGNFLNMSYRYNSLKPGTLLASVEIDLEGDGSFDLTYSYEPLNLTPALTWRSAFMNLSGVEGKAGWIRWGVVRLNLTAQLPSGAVLAIACGEEGHMSSVTLPYSRASPESSQDNEGPSPAEIAIILALLSAGGAYIIWDIRFRRK